MGSYANNITIIENFEDWQLLWPDQLGNFQLDIVGFLAILGEASILANAQVSALSRLFYLPRLLPAPQALLKVTRPDTLPSKEAHVTAVRSGNNKKVLNHVASILLGTHRDELKKHSVRCVSVRTTAKSKQESTAFDRAFDRYFRGTSKQTDDGKTVPSKVKCKAAGPLALVTLLGFSMSLTLFILSLCFGDGMSLCATIALSLLSTICGIANKWELSLVQRPNDATETKEDQIVIRYPEGSFLVVNCNEDVARELFFAPEEIKYHVESAQVYRMLALVGSLMLMLGVIFLANARLELQMAWAGAYLILNAAHWAAAALPPKSHWDLSAYEVQEEGIEHSSVAFVDANGEKRTQEYGGPHSSSFTEALYKVVLLTKRIQWVKLNEAAPATETWRQWLEEAQRAVIAAPPRYEKGQLYKPSREWDNRNGQGVVHRMVPQDEFHPKKAYNALSEKHLDDEAEEYMVENGRPFINEGNNTVAGAEKEATTTVKLQNGHTQD